MTDQKNNSEKVKELSTIRAAKALKGDGQWNLIQETLQEIVAGHLVKDPSAALPASNKLKEQLVEELERRYADSEHLEFFLENIPQDRTIRNWIKKDGWDEAVWGKVRADGLFSSANRAAVIEALRLRALMKSDTAAKLWLTMSGDYQEKMDISSDKSFDKYRELNEIIHSKKSSD